MEREFGEFVGNNTFEQFYALTSKRVWEQTSKPASQRYHSGTRRQCSPPRLGAFMPPSSKESAGCCPECESAHFATMHTIFLKWAGEVGQGRNPDAVKFAARHAVHRWGGTVGKAEGAEHGWIQKPQRTVKSAWIRKALGEDQYLVELLLMVLRFVQSHDPVEPGHEFPYRRFARNLSATDRGRTAAQVKSDIDRMLNRLSAVRPSWVEKEIFGKSQHLSRMFGLDDRWVDEDGPGIVEVAAPAPDEDYHDASAVFDSAAARVRAGEGPRAALRAEIVAWFGDAEAERAEADPLHWRALVRHVEDLAA